MNQSQPDKATSCYGLLAEYVSPSGLLEAAKTLRRAGLTGWEAYSPFPVIGLDEVLEIGQSRLPWLGLGGGLGGFVGGELLQWWTNRVDYPWLVSGKAAFGIPASIPIAFACAMLGAALAVLVGLFGRGRWFEYSHRLDASERFRRATDDRFFLLVEASDPAFDEANARLALGRGDPIAIEVVPAGNPEPERLPKGLVLALVALGMGAALPFPLLAAVRQAKSPRPPVQLSRGMDPQAFLRAQAESHFWSDGRASRGPPPGTVAWGELGGDEHYRSGKIDGAWARVLPGGFVVSREAMLRGRDRYDVYCAPCHGLAGNGDGPVSKRAEELREGTWVPSTNLHQAYLREQPVGQLYDGLTNGVRKMPGMAALLEVDDRWAVVLYLRALQRSRHASLADIPPAEREALE
jgi:mono/diheme cytochrome c family protein